MTNDQTADVGDVEINDAEVEIARYFAGLLPVGLLACILVSWAALEAPKETRATAYGCVALLLAGVLFSPDVLVSANYAQRMAAWAPTSRLAGWVRRRRRTTDRPAREVDANERVRLAVLASKDWQKAATTLLVTTLFTFIIATVCADIGALAGSDHLVLVSLLAAVTVGALVFGALSGCGAWFAFLQAQALAPSVADLDAVDPAGAAGRRRAVVESVHRGRSGIGLGLFVLGVALQFFDAVGIGR